MSIYDTKQEIRDLELLASLGYEILNPNQKHHQEACRTYENPMVYFEELVKSCDVVAFRALPDGKIPCGVYKELNVAYEHGLPVFELPVNIKLRSMDLETTRAYLTEIGER